MRNEKKNNGYVGLCVNVCVLVYDGSVCVCVCVLVYDGSVCVCVCFGV